MKFYRQKSIIDGRFPCDVYDEWDVCNIKDTHSAKGNHLATRDVTTNKQKFDRIDVNDALLRPYSTFQVHSETRNMR